MGGAHRNTSLKACLRTRSRHNASKPQAMRRQLLSQRIIPVVFSGLLGKGVFILALALAQDLWSETSAGKPAAKGESVLLVVQGQVEVSPAGSDEWRPARLNQVLRPGDRLRTGPRSRAEVRASDLSLFPVDESSLITLEAPSTPSQRPIFNLSRGNIRFLSREKPREI